MLDLPLGNLASAKNYNISLMPIVRFNGTAPEPRPGLRSGHIPHSYSLPFDKLLENHPSISGDNFTMLRSSQELEAILRDALLTQGTLEGVFTRRLVSTCGSGMTAAIIWLALQQINVGSAIFDEVRRRSTVHNYR